MPLQYVIQGYLKLVLDILDIRYPLKLVLDIPDVIIPSPSNNFWVIKL